MRASIKFFYNQNDSTVHFTEGKLGMSIGFDLWIRLESSRSLFENIETILVGIGIAHNLVSLETICKQDNVLAITMEAKYNQKIPKQFNTMYNIGRSKYVVNHHDGVKTHQDGSPFFDIAIFKNKKNLNAFQDDLLRKGYVER